METRKITVVSTSNNTRKVIMSNAATLAELKRDFDANDIRYAGMSFYEGISKTEILNDDSLLPHDLDFKGVRTNDLVFMLTNSNKRIDSGMKRDELYAKFQENSNLRDYVKKATGKNFTNVATAELQNLYDIYNKIDIQQVGMEKIVETLDLLTKNIEAIADRMKQQDAAIEGILGDRVYNNVAERCQPREIESPYTEEELAQILEPMKQTHDKKFVEEPHDDNDAYTLKSLIEKIKGY